MPVLVVLGGGIGAGKSAMGAAMRRHGADVIDADVVGHRVLEPDGAAYAAVAERWPQVVVGGLIDRSRLAAVVFSDDAARSELEAITHPAIRAEVLARAQSSTAPLVVVEVPLLRDLFGPGWRRVVVLAPRYLRRRRAVARGMDGADFDRRDAAQPSEEEWRAAADHVVVNDRSLEDLDRAAAALVEVLTAGAG